MYGKNKIEIYTYNNNRGRICEKKTEIQKRFMKLQCRIQNKKVKAFKKMASRTGLQSNIKVGYSSPRVALTSAKTD